MKPVVYILLPRARLDHGKGSVIGVLRSSKFDTSGVRRHSVICNFELKKHMAHTTETWSLLEQNLIKCRHGGKELHIPVIASERTDMISFELFR